MNNQNHFLPQRVLKSLLKEHNHKQFFCYDCGKYSIICGYCNNPVCNARIGGFNDVKYQGMLIEIKKKYFQSGKLIERNTINYEKELLNASKECQIPCPDSCKEANYINSYLKLNFFQKLREKFYFLLIQFYNIFPNFKKA